MSKEYLAEMLERLNDFTKECREDMHEPDEQGISARVVGKFLDNAFGDNPSDLTLPSGRKLPGELIVILKNDNGKVENFNLATLIALARKAKV